MWRFYYTIIRNSFVLPGIINHMRHVAENDFKYSEKYNEENNYKYVRKHVVERMKRTGHIEIEGFGIENLPKEGGYMMYPNHQGKYDVYGMISVHEKPCSFVMDIEKSNSIFIKEITDILCGKRLDKKNNRQAITIINEVAKEVEEGRRIILFPEGEYDNNKKNSLINFKSGCFKISLKSKTPIVPVVLIDSYKVFNSSEFGKIKTQVHFLKPIFYDEYKNLNTHQIADLVKEKIENKLKELNK